MGLKTILEEEFKKGYDKDVEMEMERHSRSLAKHPLREYEVPLDTKAASTLIKMATGFHAEFERQMRGESSPFYRKYLDYRNQVMEKLGKRPLNTYQILELEMTTVEELLKYVSPIRRHAEKSMEKIDGYLEGLDERFHLDVGMLKNSIDEYSIIKEIYNEKRELLDRMDPSDPEWVELKKEVREAKRELLSTRNTYRMSQQRGYFYTIHEEGAERFRELLMETTGFTNRIEDAAMDYLESLRATLPVIVNMEAQGRITSGIGALLDKLSEQSGEIMRIAATSANRIAKSYKSAVMANERSRIESRVARGVYDNMREADREIEDIMGGGLRRYINGK